VLKGRHPTVGHLVHVASGVISSAGINNEYYQGGGEAQQLGLPDTLPVLILALAYPQP
jgi:hypothetical protein